MKKTLLSMLLLGCAMIAGAQPQGMGGGFSMPETNPTYKNINYAGDDLEAHCMDIYLPEGVDAKSYKVIVAIYGSAWFANNMKAFGYCCTLPECHPTFRYGTQ